MTRPQAGGRGWQTTALPRWTLALLIVLVSLTSTGFRQRPGLSVLVASQVSWAGRHYLRPGPVQVHAALARARDAAAGYRESLDHVLADADLRAAVHHVSAGVARNVCVPGELEALHSWLEQLEARPAGLVSAVLGEGYRCLGDRERARDAWQHAALFNPRLASVAAWRLRDLRGEEPLVAPRLGGIGAVARWERAGCPLEDQAACYAQLRAMSPWRSTAPRLRALQWRWGSSQPAVRALDRAAQLAARAPDAGWIGEALLLLADPYGPDAAQQTPAFVEASFDAMRDAVRSGQRARAVSLFEAVVDAGLVPPEQVADLRHWMVTHTPPTRRGPARETVTAQAALDAVPPTAWGALEREWDRILRLRRADQDDAALARVRVLLQHRVPLRRLDALDACVSLAGWVGELELQRLCLRQLLDGVSADPPRVDVARRVVDAAIDHLAYDAAPHAHAIFEAAHNEGLAQSDDARWQYWWARTLLDMGERDAAMTAFVAARAAAPLGVYGMWAEGWLQALATGRLEDAHLPPTFVDLGDRTPSDEAAPRFVAMVRAVLQTPVLVRPEPEAEAGFELMQAGLWSMAAQELGAQTRLFGRSAPQAAALAPIAMQAAGDERQAMWTGGRRVLLTTFTQQELPLLSGASLRATWPLRFDGVARRGAAGAGIDTALVLAVMRRESAFDPRAVSEVGARGLMQMLPATARAYAARIDHTHDRSGGLFAPAASARLGAEMLARQMGRFGCVTPALSAYAAGPGKALGWLPRMAAAHATLQEDVFTERIPYPVVRDYAFEVLTSRAIYAVQLGEPLPQPLCAVQRYAR